MSKIICDVCGTSYPDTASQCPICGCAAPQADQYADMDSGDEAQGASYTYVKGGRFSKSNVRKRGKSVKPAPVYAEDMSDELDDEEEGSNRGLTIAIIVLLLAIIAVAVYIYVKFFAPNSSDPGKIQTDPPAVTTTVPQVSTEDSQTEPSVSQTEPSQVETTVDTTPQDILCTAINLNKSSVEFTAVGETALLEVTLDPVDTTDILSFSSSNTAVATVTSSGEITAIGAGTAEITVTCGDVQVKCPVSVVIYKEPEVCKISHTDVTYPASDNPFVISLKNSKGEKIDPSLITFRSTNSSVCTVNKSGTVKRVGSGTCYIKAIYDGVEYECVVRCP